MFAYCEFMVHICTVIILNFEFTDLFLNNVLGARETLMSRVMSREKNKNCKFKIYLQNSYF